MKNRPITVGWREWVGLPDLCRTLLKAKVDTGARSSSLHAFDLELFERGGSKWVRFRAESRGSPVEVPLLERRAVKSSSGASEVRPVIVTTVTLGTVTREIELTLTNRDEMGFPMLLGRQALRGWFQVDPKRSFLIGPGQEEGEREPFEIGDVHIGAGRSREVALPIATLATGTPVSIPLMVFHGQTEGPRVWVNAAVHGDEIAGVEIIRRVLENLDALAICGTVIIVPIVNVYGFVGGRPDGKDLNRSFPGGPRGSLTRRIAHLLSTQIIARCSVGIDLHTGSEGFANLPRVRADLRDPRTAQLARIFGAPVILDSVPRESSLRGSAAAAGATVLVFEGGEARRFDGAAIEAGTTGILRVLAALGVVPAGPPTPTSPRIATASRWVRAPASGLAQLDCDLGAMVEKGQILGRIHDSFGRPLGRCKSPISGLVIGQRLEPLVHRGDALVHVASTNPGMPS